MVDPSGKLDVVVGTEPVVWPNVFEEGHVLRGSEVVGADIALERRLALYQVGSVAIGSNRR